MSNFKRPQNTQIAGSDSPPSSSGAHWAPRSDKNRKWSAPFVALAVIIAVSLTVVFFSITSTAASDPSLSPYAISLAVGFVVILLLFSLIDASKAAKGILVSTLEVLPNLHNWGARTNARAVVLGSVFLLLAAASVWIGPKGIVSQTITCGEAVDVSFSIRPHKLTCDGSASRTVWLSPFERQAEMTLSCFDARSNRWSGTYRPTSASFCGKRPQNARYVTNGITLPDHDPATVTGRRMADSHARLRAGLLDEGLPDRKSKDRLLFATWNIRNLGNSRNGQSLRLDESYVFLAEVISHFDIVAVQELRDRAGLRRLMQHLGSDYAAEFSFVAPGRSGNRERLGFIYDTRKVSFGDLSTAIVFESTENANNQTGQPARPPFLAEFVMNGRRFFVVTAHTFFGRPAGPQFERRLAELEQIAGGIDRTFERNFPDHPVIFAGDLNVSRSAGPEMETLLASGFTAPLELREMPTNIRRTRPYDQILIRSKTAQLMPIGHYGVFGPTDHVFRLEDWQKYSIDMQRRRGQEFSDDKDFQKYFNLFRTFQISDHHLKWAEFRVDW